MRVEEQNAPKMHSNIDCVFDLQFCSFYCFTQYM